MPGARTERESQGQEEGPSHQPSRDGEAGRGMRVRGEGGRVEGWRGVGGGGCWLSRVELIDFGMASCVLGVCGTECRVLYIYA